MRSDRAFDIGNRAAEPAVLGGGIAAVLCGVLAIALPDNADVASTKSLPRSS
jgi:hypothetical protein